MKGLEKSMCITTLVFFFACLAPLKAQNLPAMTYGGAQDDRCYGIAADFQSSNGYVLVGWTKSIGPGTPGFSNFLGIHTDSAGVPDGGAFSLGTDDDVAQSVIRTFDNGMAIAGWTKSYGADSVGINAFVLKLDSSGVFQWGWVYSDPPGMGHSMPAYSIAQTPDSGYVLTGWSDFSGGNHDIYLLKIDVNGNFVRFMRYRFPPNLVDEGYSIHVPPVPWDYAILIAGRANITSSGNYDAFVLALNPAGYPVFPASFVPGAFDDEAYSVTWDGRNAVIAGWTNSYGIGLPNANAMIWKTDFFAPDVGFAYGLANEEKVMGDRALITTMSGDYAVCGWTKSAGPGIPNSNMLIFKVDTTLAGMQWVRVHPSAPGALDEQAYGMVETMSGYAIAGYTSSFGLGNDDFHLVTLDPQGNRPVCVIDTSLQLEPFVGDFAPFTFDSFPLIFQEPIIIDDTMPQYTQICSIPSGINEILVKEISTDDLVLYAVLEQLTVKLGASGMLDLCLFDVMGRNVATLGHGQFAQGTHLFTLPKNLSAGVYFASADFEGVEKTTKVIRYH